MVQTTAIGRQGPRVVFPPLEPTLLRVRWIQILSVAIACWEHHLFGFVRWNRRLLSVSKWRPSGCLTGLSPRSGCWEKADCATLPSFRCLLSDCCSLSKFTKPLHSTAHIHPPVASLGLTKRILSSALHVRILIRTIFMPPKTLGSVLSR